jgi:hypothetical protein
MVVLGGGSCFINNMNKKGTVGSKGSLFSSGAGTAGTTNTTNLYPKPYFVIICKELSVESTLIKIGGLNGYNGR